MKGSSSGDQVQIPQKYVFFSDPETISERAKKSSAILRNHQIAQLRKESEKCGNEELYNNVEKPATGADRKNVDSFLFDQPVKSHPFTFISAVKRKLALSAYNETSKRVYNSIISKTAKPLNIEANETEEQCLESLYETIQKMDFVKPLKVPDVKISPKTLDYASKETPNVRDSSSLKISISQKNEKGSKSAERVHRKLDFSLSEGHSLVSSDEIEPLRAPDVSISPSLIKQKDVRDNSREKENRNKEHSSSVSRPEKVVTNLLKRMKKDDALVTRADETSLDSTKRGKSPKHLSRKEGGAETKRTKTERGLIHGGREIEFGSKKPKSKNPGISVLKKEDEKKIRGVYGTKSGRDRSLESRGRTFSSESLPDRFSKVYEKMSARDQARILADGDGKYNDDYEILHALRQIEEHKQKTSVDSKTPKSLGRSSSQSTSQKSIDQPAKELHKRSLDRGKASTSKSQSRASETSEELENPSDSSSNKVRNTIDLPQNSNVVTQTSSETTPEEIVLDPAKISFRDDSYSQQDEFCDLVTPDMNLNVRTKRRKQKMNESETEIDTKTSKHRARSLDADSQNSESSFVHPTALHMQFQAELHLFDSYNESLRQVEGVEKCLYNAKNERSKELLEKQRLVNDEMRKHLCAMQAAESDTTDPMSPEKDSDAGKNVVTKLCTKEPETDPKKHRQDSEPREGKPDVRVAETQTPNDIATQTETRSNRHTSIDRAKSYPCITYERGDFHKSDIPELSLGSLEQFEDLDNIEDVSLPGKMRTMSEISLHETTSSIKTETGTEISMTTRDVTCSFNKYLDLEMAQLIKDEKLMYDKIEMLFKSREKTLNDRTKKLVKLEEQKRALRDTGQDSRISSVKKKQRALLLKLQQEKDEMNRLKELHKIASQERKLMLQKQRNMFNPQMSTKNILTKLKRSADCQSPRRLSGPMKGYDIRSNSSMSSLLESEKAQIDRAQMDMKVLLSDSSYRVEGKSLKSDQDTSPPEKLDASSDRRFPGILDSTSLNELERSTDFVENLLVSPQNLESKTRKFEEKMPNSRNYLLRQKRLLSPGQIVESQEEPSLVSRNNENVENAKSESDTLVEELSKRSKALNHENLQASGQSKESLHHENNQQETDSSRKSKALQVNEESLLQAYRSSKKSDKIPTLERDGSKKLQQHSHEAKPTSKRKGGKSLKTKSTSNVLNENILRTRNDESNKSTNNKRTKIDKDSAEDHYQSSILEEIDLNESQNSLQALVKHSRAVKDKNYKLLRDIATEQHETKENIAAGNMMDRSFDIRDNDSRRDDTDIQNLGNISTRSQVSTFTISRHSSGDSEKGFSRSVVIRAQDHRFKTSKKLEEALNAREAALVARRNCVEDWIAWHTKLKAEECRVARMEQAAFKLVSTAANALSHNDTTMSSDTSDVEGRVELLAEKLAERRVEMAKLRRETRKQAKRRLKALELNLLNQIKKYDATINEMQLKLENQKGAMKDNEKLAIESRSVADFKVPEIPLKRIQELYKSSDLLRSRSESDLIFSRGTHTGTSENYCVSESPEIENIYKTSSLRDEKNSSSSRISSARDSRSNQSAESILEEADKFARANTEKSSEASSDRESRLTNVSRSHESIESEDISNLRKSVTRLDEPEIMTEEAKTISMTKDGSPEISEAIKTPETEGKIFSEKLESLHLTNKHLNDDISSLENDLKALSQMMSEFSKKSDDKLKSGSQIEPEKQEIFKVVDLSPKNTSRDVSEEISKSIRTEMDKEISSVSEDLNVPVSSRSKEIIQGDSIVTEIPEESKSPSNVEEEIIDEVDELLSNGVSEEKLLSMKSEEIDFEARSKEILNVIEKSIISEHIETLSPTLKDDDLEKSMMEIYQENEELSHDLNSLEGDIQSISRIISKMTGSEKDPREVADPSENSHEASKHESQNFPPLELNDRVKSPEDEVIHDQPKERSVDEVETAVFNDSASTNAVGSPREFLQPENSLKSVESEEQIAESIVVSIPRIPEEQLSKNQDKEEEEAESIEEEISEENSVLSRKSSETYHDDENTENERTNESSLENSAHEDNEEPLENDEISQSKVSEGNDWTRSDSFEIAEKPNEIFEDCEKSLQLEASISVVPSEMSVMNFSEESRESEHHFGDRREAENLSCEMENVSMFLPKGESTTIGYKFEDMVKPDSTQVDELDDILDIIARESEQNEDPSCVPKIVVTAENETEIEKIEAAIAIPERIVPRPTDLNLTAEVEPVLQKLTEILQGVERNIALRRKKGSDDSSEKNEIEKAIFSEDLTSKISSLEIEKMGDQAEDLETFMSDIVLTNIDHQAEEPRINEKLLNGEEITKSLCETLSNVPEAATKSPRANENETTMVKLAEKTFEILKDPEYEDISEESLEVSEILDRSESHRSSGSLSRNKKIPEKYESKQKSEDVLRILDEISQKSYPRSDSRNDQHLNDVQISVQVFGSVSPGFTNKIHAGEELRGQIIGSLQDDAKSVEIEIVALENRSKSRENEPSEGDNLKNDLQKSAQQGEEFLEKPEVDESSESSEGADTPRGVSEIEMDSPRDPNESRLDIDALDDDLLSITDTTKPAIDPKSDFPVTTTVLSSEKDIETMIDKLKE
ncbi:centrosome-associated protein 350-like isoform X2 [Venturia canescens]|uniref:centrosome-associated protein 350-like isoform X2 n=1 Tax=Venturia canescens TaxID=32260 RepID=UPI001C9C8714|nr:centrosome-associated protein 350-like isoform X2 [Venturia canescens]